MKKRLTSFLQVALLFAAIFAMPFSANSATQRVVLEDHTGTWCGWCVSGIQAIEDLKKLHGDKFLPIAMHNQDPMATNTQLELANALWISSYPGGTINRMFQSDYAAVSIPPGHNQGNGDGDIWGKKTAAVLKLQPLVEITSKYSLDKTTRILTVEVNCEVLQDINAQLALNAVVVEDEVSGTAANWLQSNYVSSYPNDFPTHPYVNKPSKVSMVFDDVFRMYMAGTWGMTAGMPDMLKTGNTYSLKISKVVPTGINLDNIRIYGICQQVGQGLMDRVILNGVQSKINNSLAPVSAKVEASGMSVVSVADAGSTKERSFKVTNQDLAAVNYTISTVVSSRTPSDWNVELTNPTFNLESLASATASVKLTPGNIPGIGDVLVAIKGSNGFYSEEKITVVSNSLEKVELDIENAGYNSNSILNSINHKGYTTLNSLELNALATSPTNKVKTLVVSNGVKMELSATDLKNIWNLYSNGTNIFINGANTVVGMVLNNPSSALVTNLGLTWTQNENLLGVGGTNQPTSFAVKGVDGDPIGDGFTSSGSLFLNNGVYQMAALQVISGGTTNPTTFPFLKTTSPAGTAGSNMGFRHDNGKARLAILTCSPHHITMTKKNELVERIMNWVTNTQAAPKPVLSVSDSKLDFGKVPQNKSVDKMFSISNTGGGELTVNTLSLDFGDNYKFATGTPTTPFKIAAGQKVEITVVFTPTSVESGLDDGISIETDAPANANTTISLFGEGVAAAGKAPLISVASTISFDKTEVNKTSEKTLTIANKGDDNLSITKFEMFSSDFEFTSAPITPMIVKAGENVQLKVVFKPTQVKMYTAMLHITSNDPNNGMVMINLDGQGAVANSVDENGVAGTSSIFTMSAGPNPFAEMTNLKYTLAGNVAKNVEITLVNSAGSKVATIVNQLQNPGEFNVSYKATELAQGTYYFIANVAGYTTQLPVVITK